MADIIHLLPDSVANQIAAGEVIQRPASVVKELVENAIDAGAKSVQIIIKDAGRTLIQVIDNGCGMSVTDARMAFERHATSKINQAVDLFSLHTMGFRGEALPSIAAVAEIEMRTMRQGDSVGTRLIISASKVESQQPDVCTPGTNIMVKRLFFNLPARRKFLKKDSVELSHIVREFERLALVNTSVEMTLIHNDSTVHQLMAGSLKQRIGALFGKAIEHQIIPVATETTIVKIDGFVGLPQYARKRGAQQYLFVNGRNMRHPYFHKAIMQCYQELIAADAQPPYFINFEVDPETIDVNIHPQKHEIKFENEQAIWQILVASVREALGRFNAGAALEFDTEDAPEIPVFRPEPGIRQPQVCIDPEYNPFSAGSSRPRQSSVPTDWEKLYKNFAMRKSQGLESSPDLPDDPVQSFAQPEPEAVQTNLETEGGDTAPALFQLRGRYIVTPSRAGLMVIDQRRAHIRILYENFLDSQRKGQIATQRLMFADSVSLDASQQVVMESIAPLLGDMGFDIANLGNNSWAINGVPSILGAISPTEAIMGIIAEISEMEADDDLHQSQWNRIALSMARSAAVNRGTTLSADEMDAIVADLFRLPSPTYTPDNKKIFHLIDYNTLSQYF